jgi:hypothetical protein
VRTFVLITQSFPASQQDLPPGRCLSAVSPFLR